MIKNKTQWIIYIVIFVLVVGGLFFYLDFFTKNGWQGVSREGEASTTPEFTQFSNLDGRGVKNEEEVTPQVVAVMIDNHVNARPQSGLAEARVVYEASVEGTITRYMALFAVEDPVEEVGPVRSARPYYLDWLGEYGDALYLHVGGSPEALSLIKSRGVYDANEFYWGNYYWRSAKRFAPHNVYINSDNWQKIVTEYSSRHPLVKWEGWEFSTEDEASGEPIEEVKIKYDTIWGYSAGWKYIPETNKFVRYVNGQKYLDAKGSEILADNVIIQTVKISTIDDYGRKAIATIGEGEAFVIKNGRRIPGRWKKDSLSSRTRFYDESGKEIKLIPGKTWVQVIAANMSVEVTKVNQ